MISTYSESQFARLIFEKSPPRLTLRARCPTEAAEVPGIGVSGTAAVICLGVAGAVIGSTSRSSGYLCSGPFTRASGKTGPPASTARATSISSTGRVLRALTRSGTFSRSNKHVLSASRPITLRPVDHTVPKDQGTLSRLYMTKSPTLCSASTQAAFLCIVP